MSSLALAINAQTCVIRATHKNKGRTRSLAPTTAAVRHLHYGRIILDAADAPLEFSTGTHETGLIALNGKATIRLGTETFALGRYDAIYVPRDHAVVVTAGDGGCDLAEISAPVTGAYPVQYVPFSQVQSDPNLHFAAGTPSCERNLNIVFGKNVQAGRIMAGVTFSKPGNWTSWPPHEHGRMLEEAYLYIDMPAPGWGLQLVFTNSNEPELVAKVGEGDVVVMPEGYHPNVAAPGNSINFLWMMAAHTEVADRQFGVVNVHPAYAAGGSGLEAAHETK
ncbi:MAG TPA: 5-deoxy-glucuronate isomerase [Candidatus Solibacter sp.]|jgi:5-deoxy-glucuronate isomerase